MSRQPPVTDLQFTRKQRSQIKAEIDVRLAMVGVMKMVIASVNDPDVNSKTIPNPRLQYGRAIGRNTLSINGKNPI